MPAKSEQTLHALAVADLQNVKLPIFWDEGVQQAVEIHCQLLGLRGLLARVEQEHTMWVYDDEVAMGVWGGGSHPEVGIPMPFGISAGVHLVHMLQAGCVEWALGQPLLPA